MGSTVDFRIRIGHWYTENIILIDRKLVPNPDYFLTVMKKETILETPGLGREIQGSNTIHIEETQGCRKTCAGLMPL